MKSFHTLWVEGGQIDWVGHNNDAGTLLHEMIKFEQAVATVYKWVKQRKDTLVIITADHETGGFGFSYSRYQVPKAKNLPGEAFQDTLYKPNFNFGDLSILDRLFLQKSSFHQIWQQASVDQAEPTPASLMQAVNANSDFKIDLQQAQRILQHEANEYQQQGHKYLSDEYFPKVKDFKEFYVFGESIHMDLIGRQLASTSSIFLKVCSNISPFIVSSFVYCNR